MLEEKFDFLNVAGKKLWVNIIAFMVFFLVALQVGLKILLLCP